MERSYPNHNRLTDDELIDLHIAEITAEAVETDSFALIGHAAARMIASQYHGGQTSKLYEFASTGLCDEDTLREVDRELKADGLTRAETLRLRCLFQYVGTRIAEETHDVPLDDWHKLWLRQPGEPL